jgi:hypothetical protein
VRNPSAVLVAASAIVAFYSLGLAVIILSDWLLNFYIQIGSFRLSILLIWFAFFAFSGLLILPIIVVVDGKWGKAVIIKGHLRELGDTKAEWLREADLADLDESEPRKDDQDNG